MPGTEEDKTNVTDASSYATEWSQVQQKALEQAIKTFPKGTDERWDRIANKVIDKNKEQCILRYKYLAEMVKKKRELDSMS